jgi:hypothetical protein
MVLDIISAFVPVASRETLPPTSASDPFVATRTVFSFAIASLPNSLTAGYICTDLTGFIQT